MPRTAAWIVAATAVLGTLAVLWLANEVRYRNCLTERDQAARSTPPWVKAFGGTNAKSCSRSPF